MQVAVATLETDLDGVLALGPRALALAERGQIALLSASFRAESLVLGALQREDTLRLRSPSRFDLRLVRRTTTGIETQLMGAGLYHALALPRVDSVFADATPRTLLNRNLRVLLRGYMAAGIPLRYFGTEVLALLGRPVALVGYDQRASGAVLIEVFVGLDAPCVVRSALRREPPEAAYALLRSRPDPFDLLGRVVAGAVERLGANAVEGEVVPVPPRFDDNPTGDVFSVPVPIGVVEAVASTRVRLFGDLLVSTAALSQVEARTETALAGDAPVSSAVLEPLSGFALDGARPADLLAAIEGALANR